MTLEVIASGNFQFKISAYLANFVQDGPVIIFMDLRDGFVELIEFIP